MRNMSITRPRPRTRQAPAPASACSTGRSRSSTPSSTGAHARRAESSAPRASPGRPPTGCSSPWRRTASSSYVGGRGYRLGPRLLRLAATVAAGAFRSATSRTRRSSGWRRRRARARSSTSVDRRPRLHRRRRVLARAPDVRAVGAALPLWAGSAGKVFLAATLPEPAERLHPAQTDAHGRHADRPTGSDGRSSPVRRQGWAASAGRTSGAGVGVRERAVRGPHGALDRGGLGLGTDVAHPSRRRRSVTRRRSSRPRRDIERALGYQA